MGKKHKHEEHENHERWLVSYADFITLLFATFTALYAISTADLAKFKDFSSSMKDSFSQPSGVMAGLESILQAKPQKNLDISPISNPNAGGAGVMGQHDSMVPKEGEIKGKHPATDALALAKQKIRNRKALEQLSQRINSLNQKNKLVQLAEAKVLSKLKSRLTDIDKLPVDQKNKQKALKRRLQQQLATLATKASTRSVLLLPDKQG
jgi:flagellar motor protein MotB